MDKKTGAAKSCKRGWLLLALVLCSVTASAQLEIGENIKANLSGNLGYGYGGGFGNLDTITSHASGFTGSANLTGYYFHPNFVSFEFRPYFDRNSTVSDSQSVTHSTGVGGSVSLFGGSHFPGAISFGRDFSSNSEYRVADVQSLSADSSSKNFGISWSALVPNMPTFSVNYSVGSGESSFFGSSNSENSSKNLALNSSYRIIGFNLDANFSHSKSDFTTPSFLTSEAFSSNSSGTSYGVRAQHPLPFRGSFNVGWNHNNTSNGTGDAWRSDNYSEGTSFSPWQRISFYQTLNYSTNLNAMFVQSVLGGASTSNLLLPDNSSDGLSLTAGSTFLVGRGFTLNGHLTHRIQNFAGLHYEDTQYGGGVNYNLHSRLFGFLHFGLGVVDTATKDGNQGGGIYSNVGTNHKFGHWETAADANYSQNVQTIGTFVTTSSYTYGGSVRRRFSKELQWGGSLRASHSGMVTQEGSGNSSESASSFLGWNRYNVSGSYSKANGTAVLNNSGGLTPTPVGSLITNDFVLFNARALSMSVSTRLLRRVNVSAGFSTFTSGVSQNTSATSNHGDRYSLNAEYRLRKFSLLGGFNRSIQDVSTIPGGARVVNSYHLSLSRWFNVF